MSEYGAGLVKLKEASFQDAASRREGQRALQAAHAELKGAALREQVRAALSLHAVPISMLCHWICTCAGGSKWWFKGLVGPAIQSQAEWYIQGFQMRGCSSSVWPLLSFARVDMQALPAFALSNPSVSDQPASCTVCVHNGTRHRVASHQAQSDSDQGKAMAKAVTPALSLPALLSDQILAMPVTACTSYCF